MFRLNSIVATISQSGFLYRDSKFIKTALKICLTKQLHQNSAISAHQLIARLDSKRSLFPCYQPTRGKKSRGKRAAAAADESDNDSDAEHDSDSDHEDNDATGEDGLAADYKDKTVDVNSMRFNVVAKASTFQIGLVEWN